MTSIIGIGCDRLSIDPVPFQDLNNNRTDLYPFFLSRIQGTSINPSQKIFLISRKGDFDEVLNFPEIIKNVQKELAIKIFYPSASSKGKTLDESHDSISPDGKWAIKTFGIKTFADDLNNDYLIIRNIQNGNFKKIKVPALSNGEMCPAFWHPNHTLFYFMVCIGEDNQRSLELWEYDLNKNHFINIGDTNGHAIISPDGRWIVWETGEYMNPVKGFKPPLRSGLICLYETEKKVNYQLTQGTVVSYFLKWKDVTNK